MVRISFHVFRNLAKSWCLVLGIFVFLLLSQDKAQADEYLNSKVEQLEKTLQIYIEENNKLRAQIKSLTENKVSPTKETTTPNTAGESCEDSLSTCSDEELCETATYGLLGNKNWKVGSYERFVDEAKKRGLTCEVAVAPSSNTTDQSTASTTTPTTAGESCEDSLSTCSDEELCETATYGVEGDKNWMFGNYQRFVDEAKKRGLTCDVPITARESCDANLTSCSDEDLCETATIGSPGYKRWKTGNDLHFVNEAKKRNLSCDVGLCDSATVKEDFYGVEIKSWNTKNPSKVAEAKNKFLCIKPDYWSAPPKFDAGLAQKLCENYRSVDLCLEGQRLAHKKVLSFIDKAATNPFLRAKIGWESCSNLYLLEEKEGPYDFWGLDWWAGYAGCIESDMQSFDDLSVRLSKGELSPKTFRDCNNYEMWSTSIFSISSCIENELKAKQPKALYNCSKATYVDNELTQAEIDAIIPKVLSTAWSLGWIWEGQKFDRCKESWTQSDTLTIIPTARPNATVFLHYRKSKNGFIYHTLGDDYKNKYRGCFSFDHNKSFTCTERFIRY